MCLCCEIVCSAIGRLFSSCFCCFNRNEDLPKSEKKKKKKLKKEGSKGSPTKRVSYDSPLKTVSEIEETELLKDYFIELPKEDCFEPNDWLLKRNYQITDQRLGSGGFGSVFKAFKIESDGRQTPLGVKVMNLDTESQRQNKMKNSIKNELFISEQLMGQIDRAKHDHIITFYDRFIISYNDDNNKEHWKAYLFMQLAEGDLEKEQKPMTDAVAKRYFAQMVYAIQYIHRLNIAHRDLKLDNFLLVKSRIDPNKKDVKVTDFGLSRVQYKEHTGLIYSYKTGGTTAYKSPEILRASLIEHLYDSFRADIWALGVCLYRMLTNRFPFEMVHDIKSLLSAQNNRQFTIPLEKTAINREAKDLIQRLLEPNEAKRPKIDAVKAHKWLESETSITVTPSN